jgi:hypothetical protein
MTSTIDPSFITSAPVSKTDMRQQLQTAKDEISNIQDVQLPAKLNLAGGSMSGALNFAPEVDVASAGTTDIGAAASNNVRITGTTTITSFGTAANGVTRQLRFAAALTLTYNVTSLQLPGGANITTRAGDTATAISLGSGNWLIAQYTRAAGGSGYIQIGSPQTVSGVSAVDFTLNTGFRRFRLDIDRGRVATAGQSLVLRCGTGGVFDAGASDYDTAYFSHLGVVLLASGGASASYIDFTGVMPANERRSSIEIMIDPGTATDPFQIRYQSGIIENTIPSYPRSQELNLSLGPESWIKCFD